MRIKSTARIFGALILSLVLLLIPAFSASAVGPPTLTAMYIPMTLSSTQTANVLAVGNNGTTTTVSFAGANLTGVTAVSFFQGATPDPLITVRNIRSNTATAFKADIVVDAAATAGFRNVTVTATAGTSAALVNGFSVYRDTVFVGTPGTATPGSTFDVYVYVNNVSNLNSFQFDLNYIPSVIQFNGVESTSGVTSGTIHDVTFGDVTMPVTGWTYQPDPGIPTGKLRVIGQMGSANKSLTGSGYLAKVNFVVLGLAGTASAVTLSDFAVWNTNATPMVPDITTNNAVLISNFLITTAGLPEATAARTYSGVTLATSGGTAPLTWAAAGLPGNLVMNPLTGAISGTPSNAGDSVVAVTVTDSSSPAVSSIRLFNLKVYPALQITTAALPSGITGTAYSTTLSAIGGKAPYAWSATGLPSGFTINSSTGLISGTTTANGDFTVNLTVTDTFNTPNIVNQALNLHVDPNSGAVVTASVVLQGSGRPDSGWVVPLTVKFFTPSSPTPTDVLTATPVATFNLTTTKSGTTAIAQTGVVPAGTYDISVVSPHCLTNVKRGVVVPAGSLSVNMGTLLEGNCNDDNIVNITDFGILATSYQKQPGQSGWDARADFDRNGIVNISDFGLLATNYLKFSPQTVTAP